MSKVKNKITFEFDDAKDCAEVLKSISKYHDITWNNDTKQAMITTLPKEMTVLVSKSIIKVPKPLRL